jgi:prepilin-type N-terminal cleavage/methylation domain-containing protein
MNGSSKGFSLIELMVIIVILATLSTISLPIYQNYMSTSAATTYVGEFSEFKHAYENEALIARREICDADYLSQLKVESEPISALFRSRLSIDKQDGILVEVTAALDQESLAGLEAARLVHQNFQSKGAVVGSPMVTDSFVHFQAALVDCNAQSQSGREQTSAATGIELWSHRDRIPGAVCSACNLPRRQPFSFRSDAMPTVWLGLRSHRGSMSC